MQILCAIFVCIIFLGLVAFYKPYEADDDDTFSFVSFICLVFTLVLGLGLVRHNCFAYFPILRSLTHLLIAPLYRTICRK